MNSNTDSTKCDIIDVIKNLQLLFDRRFDRIEKILDRITGEEQRVEV